MTAPLQSVRAIIVIMAIASVFFIECPHYVWLFVFYKHLFISSLSLHYFDDEGSCERKIRYFQFFEDIYIYCIIEIKKNITILK